ncbi:helix-turn-helix domain-containing protein [Streptomyces brasiliscabiei]|uniref:helix-turn-helix domain-containing protein n=1 Tax=Streptomyces brasiliscabiei TaxID=2736302 RepID=UPI001C0FAFE9|nr:helix-turn-helix domain-containing protein [Streptomyces brasiliscabiei]
MGSANPVTDAERQRVRELHADGKGRNEIAKILGRSGRTISEIAANLDPPITFNRAAEVRQATEIRQADLAARRAAFAIKLQDIAEAEAAKINQPHTYWDWGGKEHDFDTHTAPEPTPGDKRAYMSLVATAVDRSLRLSPPKEEGGAEEVGALLTGLFDKLRAKHGDH